MESVADTSDSSISSSGEDGTGGEVSPCYGCFVAVVSFFFFLVLHKITERHFTPNSIDDSERWRWKNLSISTIHAAVIGISVLACFYSFPELTDDLIGHTNLFTYTTVSFSTGYFMSDSFDLISSGQVMALWPIAIHHVVVLWIFIYNLTNCSFIGYTIVALLVEINSVFLHLRKLMRIAKVNEDSLIYRLNAAITLATIVTCRFLALGWISYGIVTSYDRFSTLYLYLLSVSIFVMWIIYIMSFRHVLMVEFLRRRRQSTAGAGSCSAHAQSGHRNGYLEVNGKKTE